MIKVKPPKKRIVSRKEETKEVLCAINFDKDARTDEYRPSQDRNNGENNKILSEIDRLRYESETIQNQS